MTDDAGAGVRLATGGQVTTVAVAPGSSAAPGRVDDLAGDLVRLRAA